MAKPPLDLSDHDIDDLTALIDAATSLRTTKYEDRRLELVAELKNLEMKMGKAGDRNGGLGRPNGTLSGTNRRKGPVAGWVGPEGETWVGRGGVPKWGAKYGVTTREGMEKFKFKL